jgi:hypothetical protein
VGGLSAGVRLVGAQIATAAAEIMRSRTRSRSNSPRDSVLRWDRVIARGWCISERQYQSPAHLHFEVGLLLANVVVLWHLLWAALLRGIGSAHSRLPLRDACKKRCGSLERSPRATMSARASA